MIRHLNTVLETCFSLSMLLNYCSDHIAAAKEEKQDNFFIKAGMEISLVCRKTGEIHVFSERIIFKKHVGQ